MDIDLPTIDAKALQVLLDKGSISSWDLVQSCLAQIEKHDDWLRAMIQTTPIELLEATAKSLDEERASGKVRGPLHGIPILIKVSDSLIDQKPSINFQNRITLLHIQALGFQPLWEVCHF